MSHNIAIITVVYKNYSILSDFFASFEKQADKDFTIYVVDLTEDPKTLETPPFVQLIYSENKGYAHGLNVGLKSALNSGFEFFCFINSDTTVDSHFVENITNSVKNHPKSIIGGKIYYYPGCEYHKERYSKDQLGGVLWYAGGNIDWKNVYGVHRGVDRVDEKLFTKIEETDFITGCLMCFDKSVIDKIGYLDESYFLYFEDTDYCVRAKQAGVKLYFDPSIVIWHKNAQSTGGAGSEMHKVFQEKNRLKFGLKYAPLKTKFHLIKNFIMSAFESNK